jgi:hypothetical protein
MHLLQFLAGPIGYRQPTETAQQPRPAVLQRDLRFIVAEASTFNQCSAGLYREQRISRMLTVYSIYIAKNHWGCVSIHRLWILLK